MAKDRSKPPPEYGVDGSHDLWDVKAFGGHGQPVAFYDSEAEAVAACWDHRARIVDEKVGEARDEAYARGRAEEKAEWIEAGEQTLKHDREQQALGIEKAAAAILGAHGNRAQFDPSSWLRERAEKVRRGDA